MVLSSSSLASTACCFVAAAVTSSTTAAFSTNQWQRPHLTFGSEISASGSVESFQGLSCSVRKRRKRRRQPRSTVALQQSSREEDKEQDDANNNNNVVYDKEEKEFLQRELAHLESLEEILSELEEYDFDEADFEIDEEALDDDGQVLWDEDSLNELLQSLEYNDYDDDGDDEVEDFDEKSADTTADTTTSARSIQQSAAASLEKALLQGVVPVSAGVGNECLPGDYGFDPLNLSTKDYFRSVQNVLLKMIPKRYDEDDPNTATSSSTLQLPPDKPRPRALILRDYREAEIRHGRLAMLAAIFWPLQEMLDRLLLSPEQFGPLVYGPVTLPYFPLLMTAIMLLLGYLDIYSQAIKDMDQIGEAFLPADCFWDPLKILDGAPDRMKRNMQERELFNGRVAMLAVAVFIWEEAITHLPLIEIPGNELLLEPAYQVPFIQKWLDAQFSVTDPESVFFTPADLGSVDDLKNVLEEFADNE